ncbi:MAG: hypothetical protein K0R58_4292 [Ramlibacter sp.]|nr:hypothetical protein [Ramlibacter sp.]
MSATRDYTKYEFEGVQLGKGRLVLALIRRFVREHPSSTFAELVAVFPDRLQAESPLQFDKTVCRSALGAGAC